MARGQAATAAILDGAREPATARGIDPESVHPACVVCSSFNARGLHLWYTRVGDAVEAVLDCDGSLQGYPGRLHGAVIAAALDGAMTHCLFATGRTGVTADLAVTFKHPVVIGRPATVRARVERDMSPLYMLQSELLQDGIVKAVASAKFMVIGV